MNLKGLLICARLVDQVGVDWWGFATPDRRSLYATVAYLAPDVDPAKPWPKRLTICPCFVTKQTYIPGVQT